MSNRIVVDDTSPLINYVGPWVSSSGAGELNTTDHVANPGVNGANATFRFTGTAVAVYGTIDHLGDNNGGLLPPSSSYDVDDTFHITFVPQLTLNQQIKQKFYEAQLPDGEHTLNIAVRVPSPFGSRFRLDYIEYTPSEKPPQPNTVRLPDNTNTASFSTIDPTSSFQSLSIVPTSSSPTMTSSTTSTAMGLVETSVSSAGTSSNAFSRSATQTNSPFSTSTTNILPTQAAASRSQTSTGVIIGATIGGACLLAIALVLLCIRQKKRYDRALTLRPHTYDAEISPQSTSRPRKASEKQNINFDEDLPPPWSPQEEYNSTQEISSLLVPANLRHFRSETPAPGYRSAVQQQV